MKHTQSTSDETQLIFRFMLPPMLLVFQLRNHCLAHIPKYLLIMYSKSFVVLRRQSVLYSEWVVLHRISSPLHADACHLYHTP